MCSCGCGTKQQRLEVIQGLGPAGTRLPTRPHIGAHARTHNNMTLCYHKICVC
jgi:hypothetical protein